MAAAVLFRGLELLVLPPTKIDGADREETLAGGVAAFAAPSGAVVPLARDRVPGTATHALEWLCPTRAALADVEAFLARRRGRLTPFWLPTYRQDLHVTAAALGSWTVEAWGYAATVFPAWAAASTTGADHAFVTARPGDPASPYAARTITAVAAGAADDTLTVSSNAALLVGDASPLLTTADGAAVSLLRVARLADDAYTVEHRTGSIARVRARAVEIPRETP